MIKAYMQVDLNNPLAVKYMNVALQSFEIVKDIFDIEVIQCVTPDTLLSELKDTPYVKGIKNVSPGELGSYHSNYRMMKRLAEGEKFWIMEHDAYLFPDRESTFRKFMGKQHEMAAMIIGTATECWTVNADVARMHCKIVEQGTTSGTMTVMHQAIDRWYERYKNNNNIVYWPLNRYRDKRWINMTGIGRFASEAHNRPLGIEYAPCTQIIDNNYGSSIQEGRLAYKTKLEKNLKKKHPDLHFVTLDNL